MLDAIDRALLRVAREQGRLPLARLAQEINVSRSNAHARLTRLIDAGVITGFAAVVDPMKVGLPLASLVLLGVDQDHLPGIRDALSAMPEVEQWGFTLGATDGFALVRVADVDALRTLIVDRLRSIQGVNHTQSILIIEGSPHRQALPA